MFQISKVTKSKPKHVNPWDYKLTNISFEKSNADAVFNDGSTINVSLDGLLDLIPDKFMVDTTKYLYVSHR